jgi:hypothetical protein
MARTPPADFFAPVVRPWVEPPKREVRRRRLPTGEQPAFNPVLRAEVVAQINSSDVDYTARDDGAAVVLEPKRFARVSVPPAKREKTRGTNGPTGQKWEHYVEDAQKRMTLEDDGSGTSAWRGATSMTFVALYTLMHERVYGVEATMTATDRVTAAAMVKRLLKTKFSEDSEQFTWFFAWVWGDESKRWAATKGSKRMSWKWCFTNEKFDDWQASMRRKRERKSFDVGKVRV